MQAMLTAFITMNTSNSGIPSTKANPISRMFPPLFMIKISEEEKIAEDLHEIKSMQLIVQVIMISSIYHRHIEHFFAFFAGNTVFSLVSESPR